MATARTADTWRESGSRAERRTASRGAHPAVAGDSEPIARLSRPAVPPRGRPARPDLPPLPEPLARGGRDDAAPRRPAAQDRAGTPGRSAGRSRPVSSRGATSRSTPPTGERGGRLRGIVAVLAVFLVTLAGAAADSFLGIGLGLITLVTLTAATAIGTLRVRRSDLMTMVVAPPLIFIAVAMVNIALAPSASFSLPTVATLLIQGFPTMAVATGVGLVLSLIRWAARR
ncbi:DUF6542 domain-containing protein [Geodermatophilus ruber]|uniref:DUF6542 domain-containing protein n=1 Tax=Geodermatophilus ruber TaxID=504800 RepID=A0A1I4G1Y2_9ACTN|nr:DUF6542 domain-containing protein [Geodermatophilus ruber]SFL23723.1 hypothetical protein SAMN04488085_108101 [Geodermatophilus ruber]